METATDQRAWTTPRLCPACHCTNTEYVFTVSASDAAQHFVLRERDPDRHKKLLAHISHLWGKNTCDIRKCPACQFGFADPFVAGDGLFYNLAYPLVNYPPDKWEYTTTREKMRHRNRLTEGDVLDVAAGFGAFLDKIAPLLAPDQTACATEYNEAALTMLQGKGYRVYRDDIRSAAFDGLARHFAYLFMFQVVEHMDQLDQLFARIRYLLKDGGSAFIAVPNTPRTDFQEQTASLIDMPPNHIGRWTEAAFGAQAQRAGLELVSTEVEPFGLVKFAKVDLKFSYLKRTQQPGSIANRVRSLPDSKYRSLAEATVALAWAPMRAGIALRAARHSRPLGDSVLIELRRPAAG